MATKTLMTVEQFEQLGETEKRQELVDGEIVDMPGANNEHNEIRDEILTDLRIHLRENPIGHAVTEQEFQITKTSVRRPDVAFYQSSKMRPEYRRRSVLPFAPDLAVEVVSPSESAIELRRKIHSYLDNGVQCVWAIYPEAREAEIWDGQFMRIERNELSANCLPALAIPMAGLFLPESTR